MTEPTLRLLSLGAGVQSTALLIAAANGDLPHLDAAIFADTGWEPRAVYDHLDRLEREIAKPAGIPIIRASSGNIRNDALDPAHRFASMPLFVKGPNGERGIARRQCTSEYKIKPIKRAVRDLLGYPHPKRVPRDVYAEQWVGISTDEFHRAKDSDVRYARNVFPLLDLGWSRGDCARYLTAHGFGETPKSACLGCPFHSNAMWRSIRDDDPEGWADAVAFDEAIRDGSARANSEGQPLRGRFYLHPARIPLRDAPIDHVTRGEWDQRQGTILDAIADTEVERGCSPFACRSDGL